jgi:small subunit ribosomal protein S11e
MQTEKAYQKQRLTFQNSKAVLIGGKKKKGLRFVRNVGLGFKTPREVSFT